MRAQLRAILLGSVAAVAVALTGAQALLANETDGLAFDFTDITASQPYGSGQIKDTVTPANSWQTTTALTPFDKLTFSRTSNAMCFGSDGTLKYAPHNLVLQSQTFQTSWSTTGTLAFGAGSTVDATVAPDGTTTADLLTPDTGNTAHNIRQTMTVLSGAPYTAFFRVKPNGYTKVALRENQTTGAYAAFNLSGSGSVLDQGSGGTGSITALSDGWYLISLYSVSGSTTILNTLFVLPDSYTTGAVNGSWIPNGTSGVYLWGADFKAQPCHSTDYIPTTTAAVYRPRIDYDPVALTVKGLLMEEARTNLCLWSSDITNAAWTKTNATAAKTATGPDGVANSASTLTATADNGFARQAITSASAQRITSTYIKRRTGSGAVTLAHGDTTGSELVTNGAFAADTNWTKSAGTSIAAGIATIVEAGSAIALSQSIAFTAGKIYKIVFTVTSYTSGSVLVAFGGGIGVSGTACTAAGTYTQYLVANTGNNVLRLNTGGGGGNLSVDNVSVLEVVETTLTVTNNWTRVATPAATITDPNIIIKLATSGDEIDIAHVQCEAGAFVTSPIPTTSASATRAAETCTIATSLFNHNATAGTLFAEFNPFGALTNEYVLSFTDGTNNERIGLVQNGSTDPRLLVVDGGVNQATVDCGALIANATNKWAAAWASNDFAGVVGGGSVGTDISGTLPTINTIRIGSLVGVNQLNGHIRKIMHLPRRMSNADMQTLTAA